jgi:histidyl-tRNA synthetase
MAGDSIGFRAPRGTTDLLPPGSWVRDGLVRHALDSFGRAGYGPIETPAFEHTELFERGVGEASEVVSKQMFTWPDGSGRSLTLRPEGTAPVVRAVLERALDRGPLPVKLSYAGPMWRRERPQKGRYRQFFQVGIEALGSGRPELDAEVIEIGTRFLADAGVVTPGVSLNSIGHDSAICRRGYIALLTGFLEDNVAGLAPEDRARVATNPLRTFDSKEPKTVATMAAAPLISDHLCTDCRAHFAAVQSLLTDLSVDYTLEPRLVRGLDYYTRTAFEWFAAGLGAQNAVGGGGRYDGLSEALGGPYLPGIGFALGLDRIILARDEPSEDSSRPVTVYLVALGDDARREALMLATALRASGVGADLDFAARSMKGQMKDAARSGARWAVILGSDELDAREATVKDLRSGAQQRVPFAELTARLAA